MGTLSGLAVLILLGIAAAQDDQLDVVRKIQARQTNHREQLIEPVAIVRVHRK